MWILFGTEGCHLCEEARQLLNDVSGETNATLPLREVDIAEETQWQEQYAIRIPVLLHQESGQELAWPFDGEEVRRFLQETG